MADQASDGFVPEPETKEAYSDRVLAADQSTGFQPEQGERDYTPPAPPKIDEETPSEVQQAAQGAAAGGEEFFEIGGRSFPLNADGVREAATAWHEAQRYISSTRRADEDEGEEEYEGEYEEEAQPEVRYGDPQTVEDAYALAESEDIKDRRRGFDWALRMKDTLLSSGMEEVYDYVINGFYAANPSAAQRELDGQQLARVRAEQQQLIQPQINNEARRATNDGLRILSDTIGEAEAQTWAPELMSLVAQGAILRNPETIFDGQAVGSELVTVYQTLKGQQLMNELNAGRITPQAYQQASLELAQTGRGPQQRNGRVTREAPPAASSAHLSQLAGDRSGPMGTPPPNDYAARYKAAILAADRRAY